MFLFMASLKRTKWQEIFVRVVMTIRLMASILQKEVKQLFSPKSCLPVCPIANRLLRIWHCPFHSSHKRTQAARFVFQLLLWLWFETPILIIRQAFEETVDQQPQRVKTKHSAQSWPFIQANIHSIFSTKSLTSERSDYLDMKKIKHCL